MPADVADEVSTSHRELHELAVGPRLNEYMEPFIDLLPINFFLDRQRQKFQYSTNITEEPNANFNSFLELASSRQNTAEGR